VASGVDSAAPLQAAQERGCYAIGYDSDTRQVAPKAFLTAPVWDWYVYYKTVVESVMKGTWKSEEVWWGMETGLVKLAPYSDLVPPEVRTAVDRAAEEIKKGSLKVFSGPVVKQDGSIAIPQGKTATDPELLSMGYFVQGVAGTIPAGSKF
jgi:basic membrane protein A and related proteins